MTQTKVGGPDTAQHPLKVHGGGSDGDLHAHAYLGVRVTRVHYLDCLCLLITICEIKKNKLMSKSVLPNCEKTS